MEIASLKERVSSIIRNNLGYFVGVVVAAAAISYAASISPFTYRINDNHGINALLVNGHYVHYSAVLLTWFVTGVSAFVSDLHMVFPVLLLLSNFLAITLFVVSVYLQTRSTLLASSSGIVLAAGIILFLSRLDYTAASILLSAAACCLLLADADAKRRYNASLILGILAFVLAFSLRPKGVMGALALLAPISAAWLFLVYRRDAQPYRAIRNGIAMAVVLVALLLIEALFKGPLAYSEYRDYQLIDAERGAIHNFYRAARYRNDDKALSAAGWSRENFHDLKMWLFFDESKFNLESFRAFNKYVENDYSKEPFEETFKGRLRRVDGSKLWEDFSLHIYVFVLALLAALIVGRFHLSSVILVSVSFISVLGFLVYLAIFAKLHTRFGIPYLMGGAMFSFVALLSFRRFDSRRLKTLAGIGYLLIIGFLFLNLKPYVAFAERSGDYRKVRQEEFYSEVEALNSRYEGAVIIPQPGRGVHVAFQEPFKGMNAKFTRLALGWNTFSPLFYEQLKYIGAASGEDLLRRIPKCREVFVLANQYWAGRLEKRIQEKIGMEVYRKAGLELRPETFVWEYFLEDQNGTGKQTCISEKGEE